MLISFILQHFLVNCVSPLLKCFAFMLVKIPPKSVSIEEYFMLPPTYMQGFWYMDFIPLRRAAHYLVEESNEWVSHGGVSTQGSSLTPAMPPLGRRVLPGWREGCASGTAHRGASA